jgi:hypothetical protein
MKVAGVISGRSAIPGTPLHLRKRAAKSIACYAICLRIYNTRKWRFFMKRSERILTLNPFLSGETGQPGWLKIKGWVTDRHLPTPIDWTGDQGLISPSISPMPPQIFQ